MLIKILSLLLVFLFGFTVNSFSTEFDHSYRDYQKSISKYISIKDGLVNYKQIKVHSKGIVNFLEKTGAIDKKTFNSWNKDQKLAFLINLYNVSTIKLIIDNYPIESIKNIGAAWDIKFIDYLGSKISLNTLEHEIIRKQTDDPRIHFALVCAAKGCAVLRTNPFTASELDEQLEEATNLFFSTRFKNYLDSFNNTLYLSPIFKWYREDFEKKSGSVKKYVLPYLTDRKLSQSEIDKLKISYTKYDWSLNDRWITYR